MNETSAIAHAPITTCELTCPHCAARHVETMPADACIHFFRCTACGAVLKPKPGTCCVFCSYGSVPCPPIQVAHAAGNDDPGCCA